MQATTPKTTRNPARSNAGRIAFASLLLLGFATATRAAESAGIGVEVGVGASDNIGLAPTNPQTEVIAETGVDFALHRNNTRLNADVVGDFAYLDYLRHTYGSQLLGRFDGTGVFAIIPERLTWTLQDAYGQAQTDPFAPVTPINLQNINFLTTGPDLMLHLDPVDFIDLSARYERATYSVSPYDSNGVVGAIALGRQLAARVKASINVKYEHLKFEERTNADINRTSLYGRYEAQLVRTDLTAELGATRLTGQAGPGTSALADLNASRKLSPSLELTLSLVHELTDTGDSFGNFRAGAVGGIPVTSTGQSVGLGAFGAAGGIPVAPTVQTAGTYTTNAADGGLRFERHRTSITVTGRYERDTYDQQSQLDVKRVGAEVRIQRRFTPHLSALVYASYYRTNYLYFDFLSNDRLYGGSLTWRLGRDFDLSLRYDRTQRGAEGIGTGYHENRGLLTLGYRPPVWQRK